MWLSAFNRRMPFKLLSLVLMLALCTAEAFWTQRGNDIDGEAAYDRSGSSVSLSNDGTVVAIGAPGNDGEGGRSTGHVRVYAWVGAVWEQLGDDIEGEAAFDDSGNSVSLSGDGTVVAIGAEYNDCVVVGTICGLSNGHVRVYTWSDGAWSQRGGDIDGEAAIDQSGHSVSLSDDGTIVAIGAFGAGHSAGHVRVYAWNTGGWTQREDDIDGEAANDRSGVSVSLSDDGTVVAIGANGNFGGEKIAGHVRVNTWSNGSWTQRGDDIDGEAAYDQSGISVSLSSDGTIVAIGAPGNNANNGHVRVYAWGSAVWEQLGDDIEGEVESDQAGYCVSLSNDGTVVALYAEGRYRGRSNGHMRVYTWHDEVWVQHGASIGDEAIGDSTYRSGAVSLSSDGTAVAVGAPKNNGAGSLAGHVRVFALEQSTLSSPTTGPTTVKASIYAYHLTGFSSADFD